GDLDASNRPTPNPDLKLFAAKQQKDFLAVYKEYSERHESTRTRAYWINENQSRIKRLKAPEFVDTAVCRNLVPVPVYSATNNLYQEGFYAALIFIDPISACARGFMAFRIFFVNGQKLL